MLKWVLWFGRLLGPLPMFPSSRFSLTCLAFLSESKRRQRGNLEQSTRPPSALNSPTSPPHSDPPQSTLTTAPCKPQVPAKTIPSTSPQAWALGALVGRRAICEERITLASGGESKKVENLRYMFLLGKTVKQRLETYT